MDVCRTCMGQFSDSSQVIHLDSRESLTNSLTCRKKLSLVVPELESSVKFSSVICVDCAAALEFAYAFRRKCLETEEHSKNNDSGSLDISNIYSRGSGSEKLSKSNKLEQTSNNNFSVLNNKNDDKVKVVTQNNHLNDNGVLCDFTASETLDIEFNKKIMSYKCSMCSYNITHRLGIGFHMKMHLKDRSYWCNKCEVNTSLNGHLMNHIRTHKKKIRNYVASACISRIIVYKKQRNRETLFTCMKCNFTTQKNSELKIHLKTHKV